MNKKITEDANNKNISVALNKSLQKNDFRKFWIPIGIVTISVAFFLAFFFAIRAHPQSVVFSYLSD